MSKPQFAILRFAKYKGPEISNIEAHNERTKEKYASNPDIDKSRSHLEFSPDYAGTKYRAEARATDQGGRLPHPLGQRACGGSTCNRNARVFKGKKKDESKPIFRRHWTYSAASKPKTIISAVVHMDEKTPHMHLSFVPLTEDGRSAPRRSSATRKS